MTHTVKASTHHFSRPPTGMITMRILASLILLFVCSTTAIGQSPAQLEIFKARYVNKQGILDVVDGGSLLLGLPGDIEAYLRFQSNEIDPQTGSYVTPRLEAIWSVLDSLGNPVVPAIRWYGGFDSMGELPLVSWNKQTGEGIAEILIPVESELPNGDIFHRLPYDGCTIEIKMGRLGVLTANSKFISGVEWEGGISFKTTLPELLPVVKAGYLTRGRNFSLAVYRDNPSATSETYTVAVIGAPDVKLVGRESESSPWTYELAPNARHSNLMFVAGNDQGLFKMTVTDSLGNEFSSQHVEILDDYPVVQDPLTGTIWDATSGGNSGENVDPVQVMQENKRCRAAIGAAPDGDKLVNCEGPWVANLRGTAANVEPSGFLSGPRNPDCGTPSKGYLYPTKCKPKAAAHCLLGPDAEVDVTELVYQGNKIIPAGSVSVATGVTASAKAGIWLIGEVEFGASVTGTATMNVYETCCEYSFSGGKTSISQPTCQ